MTDCLFCRIGSKKIPARVAFEDALCLVFEDIHPQAPQHLLIIPRAHFDTLDAVPETESRILGHMVMVAARVARERGISETGYRLVINCREGAGQSVFHLHAHLLGGRAFSWPPG